VKSARGVAQGRIKESVSKTPMSGELNESPMNPNIQGFHSKHALGAGNFALQ
jgi:hypothetical protein